jgi:hypothetical protein
MVSREHFMLNLDTSKVQYKELVKLKVMLWAKYFPSDLRDFTADNFKL